MKGIYLGLAAAILVAIGGGALLLALPGGDPGEEQDDRDVLYQVSTIDALMESVYDGTLSFEELRTRGDIGIGTFDALDGEMVALDGVYYQVTVDGTVRVADDTMTTPFATVTFFDADRTIPVSDRLDSTAATALIDDALPSTNMPYAVRIDGYFSGMKVRSVPRQEKPYPRLVDAVAHQRIFEYADVEGTVVGIFTPAFMDGLNVPGYHLHFISDDRRLGGHVLDFTIENGTIALDDTPEFRMILPTHGAFYAANLSADLSVEIARVEK